MLIRYAPIDNPEQAHKDATNLESLRDFRRFVARVAEEEERAKLEGVTIVLD
jgi:hypothetical protein